MSNVPAHLQKFMKNQSSDMDSMASSGSATIPRISIKGQRFRYVIGEDESKKFSEIEVSIVGIDPQGGRMMKSYYASAYDPSNTNPPDCQSTNGIHPDAWVLNPVSETCATCPKNAFGSGVNAQGQATRGKACKDSKWLWCVKTDEIMSDDPTIYCLSVPVSSLKNLGAFGRELKRNGVPLHLHKVKISMDEEFDYAVLLFESVGFLDEDACGVTDALNSEKPWTDLIGDTSVINTKALTQEPKQGANEPKAEDLIDSGSKDVDIDGAVSDTW